MSVGPVVKRELRAYFNSPIAYIVILVFLVFGSAWFLAFERFLYQNVSSLRGYFALVPVMYIVLVPALTMRLWAEERRMGTAEILLTLPVREWELVAAKFAGTFFLLALVAVLTVPLPLTLAPLGHFDRGQIIDEYVGMLLLGASAIAMGQFISVLASNQISAFIGALAMLFAITLLGSVNGYVDLPTWLASALNYLSFTYHFDSFAKGLLDSRDVIYFALVTALFLYLSVKVLELRKLR